MKLLVSSNKACLSCLILVSVCTIALLTFSRARPPQRDDAPSIESRKRYVAAIGTLVRSTNHSINLVINMIQSVRYFYVPVSNQSFAIVIFHDENFTVAMREKIVSCLEKTNTKFDLLFGLVDFNASEHLIEDESLKQYKLGYRIMSRFWSYDVFYHPLILANRFDYLMRMDDDSYFSSSVNEDLFSLMKRDNLDYLFRSWYEELSKALLPIKRLFVKNSLYDSGTCIYNNFFIVRLNWFHQAKKMRNFTEELLRNNRMLREYIGDGCVHAAMLGLDEKTRYRQILTIGYGHNNHIMDEMFNQFIFSNVDGFHRAVDYSCQYLTVIRSSSSSLVRIKLF